ncbi:MAG TPA: amylo-alpha-1,6-glucosidase, partial [Pyrinomonadaceae bacterium]
MNTRRYHGLLVAALRSPTERLVLLSKLEETLVLDGQRFELSTNRYQRAVHPQGFQLQTGFRLDPFPVFTFRAGDVEIEKSVMLRHGENTFVSRYRFSNPGARAATFELRPLVIFRDYHSLKSEDARSQPAHAFEPGLVRLDAPDGSCTLFLAHRADARVETAGHWYKSLEYAEDRARGFDCTEDLYNPCALFFDLEGDAAPQVDIIASTERHEASAADRLEQLERARRLRICVLPHTATDASAEAHSAHGTQRAEANNVDGADGADGAGRTGDADEDAAHVRLLLYAADQFLVSRGENQQSIIAGYHWFTEWGRDTMVSLHGLALATGRFDAARRILLAFSEHLSEGMIPNRFPDPDEPPEYSTVDGTLWFVHASGELLRRAAEDDFVRDRLYEKLKEIIRWHERGTRFQIGAGDDGLLNAGVEGVPLTWMDVKVGDYVVTPRAGKPVEIEALWYNALRTLEAMARRFDDRLAAAHFRSLAEGARASFHGLFWNESERCLYDCINLDGTVDDSLRPNQIFAVSLPYPLV